MHLSVVFMPLKGKYVLRRTVENRFGPGAALFFCAAILTFFFMSRPAFSLVDGDDGQDRPLVAYSALLVGDDARARLVVDFDRAPDFSYHYLDNPARLVIMLPSTAFGFNADRLEPRGLVENIRYGMSGEGQSRIVLTASRPVKLTLSEVRQDEGGGSRLVIDLAMTDEAGFQKLVSEQGGWSDDDQGADGVLAATGSAAGPVTGHVTPDEAFVVAIDAGHGGVDTGAVGEDTKTYEKDITLDFARALARRLDQENGYQSYLTRDSDVYLSLSQRVELARQHGARLFISLHADSLDQKQISGATVYTLSDRASDRLAAALARRENLSDLIGGISVASEPEEVTDILLDLTRRETQTFSIELADEVVESFDGQIGLINNPHRAAGFMVLRAPDIPSILLEIGFLSNAEDEQRMLDPEWRDRLVDRLVASIKAYRRPVMAGGG